ncbi:hypothetical protein [Rathayibacter soli]|uniref:hypothetical protein n=1 Tax=Rathayibacter soli TaxID=3144168 RepID=UPI0027E3DDE8|nr:hypothetical protein [Glaciibacter superstes]
MSVRIERTPQQLDPLGTYAAWMLAPGAAVLAIGVAVLQTVRQLDQVSNPVLAVIALLLAVAASSALVWGSLPSRSPFRRGRFIAVLGLSLAAALCSYGSLWRLNRMIQDDWGQLVVAIMIVAMAQLRPPRELIYAAIVSSLLLGAGAWAQSGTLAVQASPLVYVVVAVAAPVGLGFGAAAFGNNLVRAIERWQARALAGMKQLEPQVRESVTRSVQQAYVTTLNNELAPLVEHILRQDELTLADTDAAATIANALRGRAIGMADTSWLSGLLERTFAGRMVPIVEVEADRAVVELVTPDQRALVGAVLGELLRASDFVVERVWLVARAGGLGSVRGEARAGELAGVLAGERASGLAGALGGERTGGLVGALGGERTGELVGALGGERTGELVGALGGERTARFELRAEVANGNARVVRARLRPYLVVLRVISADAVLRVTGSRIEVEFSYDLD